MKCAVVDQQTGLVVNIIMADQNDDNPPAPGTDLFWLPDDVACVFGEYMLDPATLSIVPTPELQAIIDAETAREIEWQAQQDAEISAGGGGIA